ncbi:flagellar hook capping FlgD N-terminal domain-containing protein [uncultured Roseobacter sp.]|uniref:flagellar hook capping FlgD N-terminal domain-containing protein n=1 Tax=uncultured Roseobacter sp. TaxID=114847 RepID=UPI0026389D07|nr:flagellar hook capping FlgD N-terminal domain-containing protein [uncultured Roseobacter sp.]
MDVTASQAAQTTSQTAAASAQSAAVLSSDFETFLQMLTAQARYQDPLEPIDSSEYAAQLAQFSMVEQQVLSNDLLQALSGQMGAGSIGEMAGWIGMEARTMSPVNFDGSPVTIVPNSEPGADQAVLIAYNANGDEVQRRQIPTGAEPVEWAGLADDGTPFEAGLYSFKVESRLLGQAIGTNPAETYSRITEARKQGEETMLVLDGGVSVTTTDVTALREPA